MSDNNLTNIKQMSNEQIMQAIGQDDGSNAGSNIPRLAINRTPEDDDGNQLPVGHYFTYDSKVGQNVFAKPITLRPFVSAMQYMHYDPDKSEYVKSIINSLSDLELNIIFEPGRSIVGDCGILVSQVQYVKESSAKNFLIIDASMSELMRPPLYGAYHEITPTRKSEMPNKVYDVVGPVCESSDFIGKERKLNCKSGDLVVIQDVGAYGSVLSSNYNTRPRPAEYMISNSEIKLIRTSDTLDQIIENESC